MIETYEKFLDQRNLNNLYVTSETNNLSDFYTAVGMDSCSCLHFSGTDIIKNFWVLTCPCGISTIYAMNSLPEVDTLSPCGNPKHWLVRYTD